MNYQVMRRQPDWGHVGLIVSLLIGVFAYATHVYSVSNRFENWLLVLPVSAVTACLLVALLIRSVMRGGDNAETSEVNEGGEPAWHTVVYFVLMGVYVLVLDLVGFDVATALFLFAALLLKGERRILTLIGFPVAFAVLCTWAFKYAIPYPIQTWLPYP